MTTWLWWVLVGFGVTVFCHFLFPIRRGLQFIETLILSITGALIAAYLATILGHWRATHWAVILAAGIGALLFFWLVRLFSFRRLL